MPTIQAVLNQSLHLPNGQTIPNRLVKSAMSETLGAADCRAPSSMATLYGRWADGGVGLSITGNVMVDRRALGEAGNVVVEDDRDLDALSAWATAGKRGGGLIYMQINHPGRQAMKGLNAETVAPSAVPFAPHMQRFFGTPRALEPTEIEDIIARFATAATVAEQAGFDGVQIHAAHGYLISQFLSPQTNLRDDAWGGDAERRRAFALATYRAIRAATGPEFGVGIKINSADFQKGGISEEESADTILALAGEGMDFVEISGGTYEAPAMAGLKKASTQAREAYFLTFAEALRSRLTVPLLVTGGFRSGQAMADAVASNTIDLVGLARPLAVDPDFPRKLLADGEIRLDLPRRRTGIKFLDKMGMLEVTWYERQLHRMAKGKPTRPNESGLRSFFGYLWSHGFIRTLRARRAR